MSYKLDFSAKADLDIDFHKKSGNKILLKKLFILLNEVVETPFEGTGKPVALKHSLVGCWSRRINIEHRLIYEVKGDIVFILSAKGHYE